MKALVCEMCNSNDLVKEDGMYVCQHCGTKYTVEEAKKLMMDVSGSTVKIDDTAKVDNYYTMAVNAYEAGNKSEAENYCNKIIEIEPNNYKAWLIKGKAAGWQSTIKNIRLEESLNCFSNAIKNSPEDDVENIKKEAADEMSSLSKALINLCSNNFADYPSVKNGQTILTCLKLVKMYSVLLIMQCGVEINSFNGELATTINSAVVKAYVDTIKKDYDKYYNNPTKYAFDEFTERSYICIEITETILPMQEEKERKIALYKNIAFYGTNVLNAKGSDGARVWSLSDSKIESLTNKIMDSYNKIKELDSSFEIPKAPVAKSSTGCYVATAVYGSYDCPQVWTLRRYRDNTLAKTWYGRAFIRTYYAVSPTFVKFFGNTSWFKSICKPKLDRMVKKLNASGVDNTEYEDKKW